MKHLIYCFYVQALELPICMWLNVLYSDFCLYSLYKTCYLFVCTREVWRMPRSWRLAAWRGAISP